MTPRPGKAGSSGIIVFDTNQSQHNGGQKQTRVSLQKVRTGCITCKKRHVKCDERKPHCNNCLRTRGQCEGYEVPQRKKKTGAPAQICWDSRQHARSVSSSVVSSPRVLKMEPNPSPVNFRDATSVRYFDEFVNLVQGPWIAAASNGEWWRVMLPQLARNSSSLLHAAIGIGALSTWHKEADRGSMRLLTDAPVVPDAEKDTHYLQAISHYCQSLRLQSQEASMTDAVFLSVMLVCFEALRGSRKTALAHINHGLALLLTLVMDGDTDGHVSALGPNPRPVLEAVADIYTHLAGQARAILPGRFGDGKPLPNFVKGLRDKKQTMESFMVMLSQVPELSVTVDDIPDVFTSLDEFEDYWMASRRKQVAMGPALMEIILASGILTSTDPMAVNAFYHDILENPKVKKLYDELQKTTEKLENAFLPLFNALIMSDNQSPTYMRAIHLRLQFVGVYIFENPSKYLKVESLEAQTPYFQQYLSMAEIALRAAKREIKNPAHQLSLQCGLSWYLLLIAMFCRDPLAREEAIHLLKDYPGQDGVWNTRALYALALRNREVERLNALEGTAKEQWQRLWRREYIFEEGGDRVIFRYLSKADGADDWELIEEAVDIQGDLENLLWQRQPLTGSGGLLMGDFVTL
ncbi:hypothetical protein jhhlp_005448 [Lomentospora prolificans]|uniref:Zn(2)-C6 fungal-type domain-containing protein n=1 Tax=Lomentospora prolificans TaxID=41688 RepID=A0A2N3N716_9PEZI|nr:hypothetical protein jhhlp_005448 [Lomentospora prolificans]